ncbi:retrovirus-related pol polyprotein from transposon TNT 1-94 [Tanacetum coccineum]
MAESQFNMFKKDNLRVLLALEIEELLQLQGEIMQLVNQESLKERGCGWGCWWSGAPVAHQTIPQNSAFQNEDLDAHDSNYDDLFLAEKQYEGKSSSCDSNVLIQPTLYDGSVIAKEHTVISVINDDETLILEEESRSKMFDKQNDPISIEKKIKISLINCSKLNKLKADFGKYFVNKKELFVEQAFWLKHSSFSETPVTSHTPVRMEAPSELPMDQIFEWKDSVENVKKDIDEIETINIELEHSVAKLLSENENLRKEREHLKSIYKDQFDSIRKTRVQSKEHCDSLIAQINAKSVENSDLNAQLQEKVFAIAALKNELRKLKGKNVVDTAVSKPSATIAPGMFKLDIEPISHRLKNNRDAHEVYIEKTIENTDTLRGFVERARTQNPSEPLLESACMFTKHVQELLVYVSQTCPNSPKPSEKVKPTTIANGSKPSGNTKNNMITQPPRSNQKNKVEEHPRKVKSSLNKMNSVSKPNSNALVKHFMRNAKFESICAILAKAKIVESKSSNSKEPKQSWGSIVSDVPSSSLNDWRLSKLFSGIWTLNAQAYDQKSLSTHQLCQFCDSDLEVAFYKHTCFIRDLDGVDLLKASNTKSWLWHRILSHLNFDYITPLAKHGLVRGLPKLKYQKDHMCSACALGKSKKHSHRPKAEDSIQEKLYLLHMDLYGPMRIQSIKGRKYILVIIDDYSRTDNGTEFFNQTLKAYYEEVRILHQTSVARTLQQNDVVKRRNHTLVEAGHLGKLKPKADIGIFVGYALAKKAFRIYNKRTQMIIETIHVDFDELTTMTSEQFSSGPRPKLLTPGTISSGLVQNIPSSTPYVLPTKNDWEILFQPMFDEYLSPLPCVDP